MNKYDIGDKVYYRDELYVITYDYLSDTRSY